LRYFFSRYQKAVDSWAFVDNSAGRAQKIAENTPAGLTVVNPVIWQQINSQYA